MVGVFANVMDGLVEVLFVETAAWRHLCPPALHLRIPHLPHLLHLQSRVTQQTLLTVPDPSCHQLRDLPRQVAKTEGRSTAYFGSVVIHPFPKLWPRETIGRVEAAEIGYKCTHDLRVPTALPPLVDLTSETVNIQGEEGRAGVERLVVVEGGCGEEGEAELEGLGDTLVDPHDYSLIRTLDQPQQQYGDLLRWHVLPSPFSFNLPLQLHQYPHLPLRSDDETLGVDAPE